KKKCKGGLTTCKIKKGKKKKTVCVNAQTDPNNCGGCARACAAGESCIGGACVGSGPKPAVCDITIGPADDLRQAVDAATPGARVCLEAGTYPVAGRLTIGKALTLIGKGAAQTILQGDGSDGVLELSTAAIDSPEIAIHLEGLTVTGGNALEEGGGILGRNHVSATLVDCVIANNEVTWNGDFYDPANGGGIAWRAKALEMRGCTISNNQTGGKGSGGGIMFQTTPSRTAFGDVTATLRNCTITENTAFGGGGGISVFGTRTSPPRLATIDLVNCTISGNTGTSGGGLSVLDSIVSVRECLISENDATNSGGGIWTWTTTKSLASPLAVTLHTTTVRDNEAAAEGGGISNGEGGRTFLFGSSVTTNTAGEPGGGIANHPDNPVGAVTLNNGSTVTGNDPDNCDGTAIAGCVNEND
ncbi:MAG: hypothetical protein M3Z20_08880, partial [Chloroflexota bacterium]|nr:hypothetical protein [Chloroflexota bacterium]